MERGLADELLQTQGTEEDSRTGEKHESLLGGHSPISCQCVSVKTNNSNSLVLTQVKGGGGYCKEMLRKKARKSGQPGLRKDKKQRLFWGFGLLTLSPRPLSHPPLHSPFPLSNNQLVHDFCLNTAIMCSSLHTLTF